MRVLLISSNVAQTPYAVYPLGLSLIAAALRNAGHDVLQWDYLENETSLERMTSAIRDYDPGMIGISIRNIDSVNLLNEQRYVDAVIAIVREIRNHTKVPVVLGGSGFSIMPEAFLEVTGADYGIVGEGESSMTDLVEKVSQGVPVKTRCIRPSRLLDGREIPSPWYDPQIMGFYLKQGNVASVQTKRGCVYKCVYCSYPLLEGNTVRARDPRSVVDDIQALLRTYDTKYIFFTDSVFNDPEGHGLEVVREMKARGISVPWTAFFKPKGLDDESVALMKETGLKAAEVGSDGPTDQALRGLGKPFTFADILECNQLFSRHGIVTGHYYMFGCPGETTESVLEGIENIIAMKDCVSFIFMGIRILPGTQLEERARREGVLSDGQSLLDPVYYIAPGIDPKWLEQVLKEAFASLRHCIFPPDALNSQIQFLHKLGYSGSLWDALLPGKRNRETKPST